MNCAFISGAQWSPRSWSHHHMSPCRSSVRFPEDHESPCCDFAPCFSGVQQGGKNQWFFHIHSRDMVVEFDLLSSPLGSQMLQCLQEQHLGPAGPFGSLLAQDLLCGWSKPWVDERITDLDCSTKHVETVALENPLDNMCVKISLCVCVNIKLLGFLLKWSTVLFERFWRVTMNGFWTGGWICAADQKLVPTGIKCMNWLPDLTPRKW